jgi:ABC-2 type transport system permease protein
MMRKFFYLTGYSIKKKLKSKSFIITNVILLLLVLIITNLDGIIKFFGGDFNDSYNIIVVDNSDYDAFLDFKNNFEKNKDLVFKTNNKIEIILSNDSVDLLKKDIENTKDIIVVFNNGGDNYISADVITKGYISTTVYQPIVDSINKTKYNISLNNSNISQDELDKINELAIINRIILDENKSSEEETVNTMIGILFPILLLPFFLLILFLIQIIGGEINEEKTTRSMEIIISNVSAKTHLFSHLIADNVFIFVQMILLSLYGVVGGIIKTLTGSESIISNSITEEITGTTGDIIELIQKSGILDKLSYVIPIAIILMILSFISYSFLAAVLASMSTNLEDYQQVQTPIMMVLLASFYLSLMSSLFEGSSFIKTLSFMPLISCMLSPTLLIVDQISIIDSIISIVIMIIFIIVTYIYGIRIYRTGILNYSSDKIWRRMLKAARGK